MNVITQNPTMTQPNRPARLVAALLALFFNLFGRDALGLSPAAGRQVLAYIGSGQEKALMADNLLAAKLNTESK